MSSESETRTAKAGRRLLVLDDEVMTGETIRRIGEFAGWDSTHTTSPEKFFELVRAWSPDVIALDLLMPDMDGVEVMARLSDLGCDADLIITSGVEDKILSAADLAASERGLNTIGVLSKPFAKRAHWRDSRHLPGGLSMAYPCRRTASYLSRKKAVWLMI